MILKKLREQDEKNAQQVKLFHEALIKLDNAMKHLNDTNAQRSRS